MGNRKRLFANIMDICYSTVDWYFSDMRRDRLLSCRQSGPPGLHEDIKVMMVKNKNKIVIVIPAYNPDEKMTAFLQDLKDAGYTQIIVTDDGSLQDARRFFTAAREDFGCKIVSHSINLGQGRTYKTAFNYFLSETGKGGRFSQAVGIIQCDCDGQHHVDDIDRCAELLCANPGKFILGVRDFSDRAIPFRSRFGNRVTSFVFRIFAGMDLEDTQSGLRGIPAFFIPVLMEVPGERFEYASSCLLAAKKHKIEILQFPIRTIYINKNETSHFRPVKDSIRIYSLLFEQLFKQLLPLTVFVIGIAVSRCMFHLPGKIPF